MLVKLGKKPPIKVYFFLGLPTKLLLLTILLTLDFFFLSFLVCILIFKEIILYIFITIILDFFYLQK